MIDINNETIAKSTKMKKIQKKKYKKGVVGDGAKS
jgi:hypothetical protein